MSKINIYQDIMALVSRDLGLDEVDVMSEDDMLVILVKRVDQLLKDDRDLLMSYLYRLDVPQKQIMAVLRVSNIIPPEEGLARIILDRQIKRVKTKLKYRQEPIEGWEF